MISPANDAAAINQTIANNCDAINSLFQNYIEAAAKARNAAIQGADDIARNMNGLIEETYTRALSAYKAVMSAKSPQEAAETQTQFFRDCFDGFIAGHGKMSEISLRLAKGTLQPLTETANAALHSIMKEAKVAA